MSTRAQVAVRKSKGMCPNCGVRPPETEYKKCAVCREADKKAHDKRGKEYYRRARYVTGSHREGDWRRQGIVGLTYEHYQAQATHCRICGTTEKLVADHDHTTHQFRGVLCQSCNHLLGFAKDNLVLLRCAELYLGGQPCH